jgi:hypothetical protein
MSIKNHQRSRRWGTQVDLGRSLGKDGLVNLGFMANWENYIIIVISKKIEKVNFAKISHDSLVSIWSPKLLIATNDKKLLDSKSKLVMNYFR